MTTAAPTESQLVAACRDDWLAACETRREVEERKTRDYQLYRRYREDIVGGGHERENRGPFGWSKLTVPIIFWTCETILPRIAIQLPKFVVSARTADAVPFAMAKELRLNRQMELSGANRQLIIGLKQMIVLGDGPTKVGWDERYNRPRVTSISWWDFWLSADAIDYETAECIFHRTWYTRRQIEKLAERKDSKGEYLYHNLDKVLGQGPDRATEDPTYADRREAAGLGPQAFTGREGDGIYSLVECWYDDGSVAVLGGGGNVLVQYRDNPHKDEHGYPLRPFAVFRNTPDLHMPYSISDAEMLEDHQDELSVIRNQGIDQMTADINAPVIYSGADPAEVDAAFGVPGGKLRVQGDVRAALMRLTPGQVSVDVSQVTEMIRGEAQLISGINDYAAGQASAAGVGNQTATGIQLIVGEANQRWRLKQRFVEMERGWLGRIVHCFDRRYGPGDLSMPLRSVPRPGALEGAQGIDVNGSVATVSGDVDAEGLEYDVEVKEGTAAPPSQREHAQMWASWLGVITSVPTMAALVDWPSVARDLTAAFGLVPEKVLLSTEELAQQQAQAAQAAQAQGAQTGMVPVGPPEPIEAGQNGGGPA